MKKFFTKKLIIIYLLVVFFVAAINIYYLYLSSCLKIVGDNNVTSGYGEKYIDKGATFKVFNIDLSRNVKIKNNINNKKIGEYKVTYIVKYLIFSIKKERIVNIVDKQLPVITLVGESEVKVCSSSLYKEDGYKAIDEVDGDITDKVKVIKSDSEIIYEVTDSSGNTASIKRKINTVDDKAPSVSLKGNKTIYVKINTNYVDYGVDVSDNCDSNPIVNVTNNVNINNEGRYVINYEVTDSSNNKTNITRNVIVYDNTNIGVVYLTFDDGPNVGTTDKILNVLKENDVKATFFVTSNGPDYLIKREYDEGHKVAIHTSTHNYSYIYSSIDNYFQDLLTVQNRVSRITGETSKIIRFPGGSNNTVSNNYSPGIMNKLTSEVTKRGYLYFDWNVSAEDAGVCRTEDCVYNYVINGLSKYKTNVVLMHDIKSYTANVLSRIIEYCKMSGYVFKTIDETTYPVVFN